MAKSITTYSVTEDGVNAVHRIAGAMPDRKASIMLRIGQPK